MRKITEEYVNSRLQLMRAGVLYLNGYIRLNIDEVRLSDDELLKLRGEGTRVSQLGLILKVQIDDDGQPNLVLSNSQSDYCSQFERTAYENSRAIISSAAIALHHKRERASFPKTVRRLKKEGFSISRQISGEGYLIEADDKDLGSRTVSNCHLHTALDAVTDMRAEFSQLISAHYTNTDYVVVDALNYQIIKREIISDGKIDYRNQKPVRVQSITGESILVTWDISCLGLVAKHKDRQRQLVVVEKDSPLHLRSLNHALAMKGLIAQKTSKGFNVYRLGMFHKPIFEGLQSPTDITKQLVLIERSNGLPSAQY